MGKLAAKLIVAKKSAVSWASYPRAVHFDGTRWLYRIGPTIEVDDRAISCEQAAQRTQANPVRGWRARHQKVAGTAEVTCWVNQVVYMRATS